MFGVGLPELLIIGVIIALIFGPKQLPKLGRSLGETISSFRAVGREIEREDEDDS